MYWGRTPTNMVAWLWEVNTVGILVIGSYVYHSDVIATSMQIYVNIIQITISLTIYQFYIYKLVQMSHFSSDI